MAVILMVVWQVILPLISGEPVLPWFRTKAKIDELKKLKAERELLKLEARINKLKEQNAKFGNQ